MCVCVCVCGLVYLVCVLFPPPFSPPLPPATKKIGRFLKKEYPILLLRRREREREAFGLARSNMGGPVIAKSGGNRNDFTRLQWFGFASIGLINNFGYVVILSAAKDLACLHDLLNLVSLVPVWSSNFLIFVVCFSQSCHFPLSSGQTLQWARRFAVLTHST